MPFPKSTWTRERSLFVTIDPRINKDSFKQNVSKSLPGNKSSSLAVGKSAVGTSFLKKLEEVFIFKDGDKLRVSSKDRVPWYHRDDLEAKMKQIDPQFSADKKK